MPILVRPAAEHLPSYVDALRRGWSPDNVSPRATAQAHLVSVAADPEGFLAALDLRDPGGATIALPDGSRVPRLPGFVRWIWDGEMAGSIGLRWQPGTDSLPAHVLGHVGYAVVPWKRRLGYATEALRLLMPEARAIGLGELEITVDPDNFASRRTLERNGGVLVESFLKVPAYGGGESLRYRLPLVPA